MHILKWSLMFLSLLIALAYHLSLKFEFFNLILSQENIRDEIFKVWFSSFMAIFTSIMIQTVGKMEELKADLFKKKFDLVILAIILGTISLELYIINLKIIILPKILIGMLLSTSIFLFGLSLWNIPYNLYFGVRIPWIMEDKELWRKTQKFSAVSFFIFAFSILIVPIFVKFDLNYFWLMGGLLLFIILIYSILIKLLKKT